MYNLSREKINSKSNGECRSYSGTRGRGPHGPAGHHPKTHGQEVESPNDSGRIFINLFRINTSVDRLAQGAPKFRNARSGRARGSGHPFCDHIWFFGQHYLF